jgi:tRNA dimethylallyltransferase
VDPVARFTAARYVELADRALGEIASRGAPAIVAGGTGLYLRALLEGIFPSPPPDPERRVRLQAEAARAGWPSLHARLAAVDPEAAARIHPNDPVRIERALEVFEQTGQPLSSLHARHARSPRHQALVMVIDPLPAELDRRIAARTEAMLAAGLVDETAALAARWGRTVKPLAALGYKEALAFLDGRLARAALPETIRIATRRFARRQRTWFKKQPGSRVTDASEVLAPSSVEAILRFVAGTA